MSATLPPGTTPGASPGTTPGADPGAGGSGAPGADGSVDVEALRVQIAERERDLAEERRKNAQLLSERTNVEAMRRELEDRQRGGDPLREIVTDLYEKYPELRHVLPALGNEIEQVRTESQTLKRQVGELLKRNVPSTVPKEVADAAYQRYERGESPSFDLALQAEIGARVMAGTFNPTPAPAGGGGPEPPKPPPTTAPRPQPVVQPVQTVTRSVLPPQPALKDSYTESEYHQLPAETREQIFRAQRAGGGPKIVPD